eukprot:gnl/Dysnectes_brevis/3447_a4356_754.p1 GENE.gnl/Dysnectes_brevis/3447_a4356_754~~gnl/Dysnectes_brevis/3447_a4356_754.p1  ORF type:complete len:555 (+),score=51.33 gnl/Dysnectes_brevis/3447_a4356_754:85-1749(+)
MDRLKSPAYYIWTNIEDETLKAAISKYGLNNWSTIASLFPHKTAKQCRTRWREYLNPSIKKTEWSTTEDTHLLEVAKAFPSQWKSISNLVGRPAHACINRYNQLIDQATAKTTTTTTTTPTSITPIDRYVDPLSFPAKPDPKDLSEDAKEMLAETVARLANTQGKKAKRRARERMLQDSRRVSQLMRRRELKRAGMNIIRRGKGDDLPGIVGVPTGPFDTSVDRAVKPVSKDFSSVKRSVLDGDMSVAVVRKRKEKDKERRKKEALGAKGKSKKSGHSHANQTAMSLIPAVALSLPPLSKQEGDSAVTSEGRLDSEEIRRILQSLPQATVTRTQPLQKVTVKQQQSQPFKHGSIVSDDTATVHTSTSRVRELPLPDVGSHYIPVSSNPAESLIWEEMRPDMEGRPLPVTNTEAAKQLVSSELDTIFSELNTDESTAKLEGSRVLSTLHPTVLSSNATVNTLLGSLVLGIEASNAIRQHLPTPLSIDSQQELFTLSNGVKQHLIDIESWRALIGWSRQRLADDESALEKHLEQAKSSLYQKRRNGETEMIPTDNA